MLKKAADQNSAYAMYEIAWQYHSGRYIRRNTALAKDNATAPKNKNTIEAKKVLLEAGASVFKQIFEAMSEKEKAGLKENAVNILGSSIFLSPKKSTLNFRLFFSSLAWKSFFRIRFASGGVKVNKLGYSLSTIMDATKAGSFSTGTFISSAFSFSPAFSFSDIASKICLKTLAPASRRTFFASMVFLFFGAVALSLAIVLMNFDLPTNQVKPQLFSSIRSSANNAPPT